MMFIALLQKSNVFVTVSMSTIDQSVYNRHIFVGQFKWLSAKALFISKFFQFFFLIWTHFKFRFNSVSFVSDSNQFCFHFTFIHINLIYSKIGWVIKRFLQQRVNNIININEFFALYLNRFHYSSFNRLYKRLRKKKRHPYSMRECDIDTEFYSHNINYANSYERIIIYGWIWIQRSQTTGIPS